MIFKTYYWLKSKLLYSYHYRFRKNKNWLKEKLVRENKLRWLDLGSSVSYNDGFYFSDILPIDQIPENMRDRYMYWDAIQPLSIGDKTRIGTFDLIRMQHVFEHFSPEDGQKVLNHAFDLLNEGGYLLITVPNLKEYIRRYKRNSLAFHWSFAEWAQTRVENDAPQSFYFSIFTHSVPHQAHLWCYDQKGLAYQINRSVKAKNIEFLSVFSKKANIPFTHNRPLEDLCVLIKK